MGFDISNIEESFKLTFADPAWDGFEIRARSVSVQTYIRLVHLYDGAKNGSKIEHYEESAKLLAEAVTSWNLERKGQPVPVSAEALLDLGFKNFWALQGAWLRGMSGVSVPLDGPSPNGEKPSENTTTTPVADRDLELNLPQQPV